MIIHEVSMHGRTPEVLEDACAMTQGSLNADAIRITTDALWEGCTLTAQFTDRFGTQVVEVLPDEAGLFTIPAEMAAGEQFGVTLVGIRGEERLVSGTAWLRCAVSRYAEQADTPEATSPTLAEQLAERVAKLEAQAGQTPGGTSGLTLIDTYTYDGKTAAVYLNQEPDGTAYDFERVLIVGAASSDGGNIADTGVININGQSLYGTGRVTLGYTPSIGAVGAFALRYDTADGFALCAARTLRDTIYQSAQMSFNTVFVDSITSIEFQSNKVTPTAGATLKIFAKRR